MWVLAGVVIVVPVIALVLLRRRIVIVTVRGESMMPTYATGDRVLVRRTRLDRVRPGDVVVIEEPDANGAWPSHGSHGRLPAGRVDRRQWMIKRVVALPGQPGPAEHLPTPRKTQPDTVPPGSFVVRGDNALRSYDSRQLGYIPSDRLLGVVARVLDQ